MLIPLVGAAGFEPATSWSQTRRDDRTTLRPELLLPIRQFHAPLNFGGLRFTFVKLRHQFCGFSSLSSSTLLRWERDYLRWSPLHRCEASARTLRFLIPLFLHVVAVGAGFEPAVRLPVRQFSKLLVSATHPSHLVQLEGKNRKSFW